MSEPFVGEIRMFAGNFAPRGWAFCDGQLLAVSQNDALFSLFGTIYGGDGRTTFGLPDMRGRLPIHAGTGPGLSPRRLGAKSGAENVTLTVNQLPSHTHPLQASTTLGEAVSPQGNVLAAGDGINHYTASDPFTQMSSQMVTHTGGSRSHTNLMPFLCVNFIVALFGIYPSRHQEAKMSEPFIAEIRIFAGNFAPRSWAFCNGQLLPIAQNTALFSLIGTTYGGDGRSTTALPNLEGRAPMHPGRGPGLTARHLGQRGGSEQVTLTEAQLPNHSHTAMASTNPADTNTPSDTATLGRSGFDRLYQTDTDSNQVDLAFEAMPEAGGGVSHNNMQPYLTLNFIIALQGLYPSRS